MADGYAGALGIPADKVVWNEYVEIDCRVTHDCYSLPPDAKVVHAIQRAFGEDDDRRTRRPWRSNPGVWRIETPNLEKYRAITDLKYDDVTIGKITIRKEKVTMKEDGKITRKVDRHANDLFVTLFDADSHPLNKISHAEIHRKIVELDVGRIKKAVTKQNWRNTTEPNGNKYFILENVTDSSKIPRAFDFYHHTLGALQIKLQHNDQKKKCFMCEGTHGRICPVEAEIQQLVNEREAARDKGVSTKIYSDSTLRRVNQESLTCDVDVMSGGTTGNLLNAVEADKKNSAVENLVLVSGANDMRMRSDLDEYVYSLKVVKDRITQLLQTRKVSIMLPPKTIYFSSDDQVKQEYFYENLEGLRGDGLSIVDNPISVYDDDDHLHPSKEQTLSLCKQIDSEMLKQKVSIMLPSAKDEHVVRTGLYQKVTALYRYGCSACGTSKENVCFNLCDSCRSLSKEDQWVKQETEALRQRIHEREIINRPFLDDDDDELLTTSETSTGKRNHSPSKDTIDDGKRGRRDIHKSDPIKSVEKC